MNPGTWQRIQQLFHAALALEPGLRIAFLDRECEGEPGIRAEVEKLLRSDARAGDRIGDALEAGILSLAREQESTFVGRSVGPYRISRLIGEGGLSAVYLAMRADDQFQQRVALKLVKPGMDTQDIVRRFRTERQILAGLDHPNIARLFDGGASDEGRPYFAMEYIEGVPINAYCDHLRLSIEARLRLFCTVCAAVQYAHQNLVVHRDIKPGNILVTAEGAPKLLDFGIAKLLDPDLSLYTVEVTAAGRALMTPEYASPEQIRGNTITTATDVYSLGVLLYVLLTGHHPYRMASRTPQEIERVVCDTDPQRPSTMIRAEEAALRDERPERLRQRLAGDIDTIVLKALQKDPLRRYGSALQFAEDIQRHLEGRPVLARKDTLAYRTSRFIRRNKVGVAIFLLVVALAVTMTIQSIRVARERDTAAHERDRAEKVSSLLVSLFEISDPNKSRGTTVPAREILDQGATRIREELADQPEVRAQLMDTMGRVYQNLGIYDRAAELFEDALDIRRRLFGESGADVAASLNNLGDLLRIRGEYERADSLLRESLRIRRADLGPEHVDIATSMSNLGQVLAVTGDYAPAESLFRHSLEMRQKLLGPRHIDTARSMNNLGLVLYYEGKLDDAGPILRQALETRRSILGEDHPEVARSLNNLSMVLTAQGDYAGAESLLRDTLAMRRKTLGDRHPDVASAMVNLASVIMTADRGSAAAESLFTEAIAIKREVLGNEHPEVAIALANLASLRAARGDTASAETLFRESLAIYFKRWPGGHPDASLPLLRLGLLLLRRGDAAEAEKLLEQDLHMLREEEAGPVEIAEAACGLGAAEAALHRYARAESLLVEHGPALMPEREDALVTGDEVRRWLADLYDAWGKPEQAAAYRAMRADYR